MDKMIEKLTKQAAKNLGAGSDYMIIAHKEGVCSGSVYGNAENLAQAFFALIHQDNDVAKAVYRIVKLNAMNIISNPSPYAMDLMSAISNILPETKSDE